MNNNIFDLYRYHNNPKYKKYYRLSSMTLGEHFLFDNRYKICEDLIPLIDNLKNNSSSLNEEISGFYEKLLNTFLSIYTTSNPVFKIADVKILIRENKKDCSYYDFSFWLLYDLDQRKVIKLLIKDDLSAKSYIRAILSKENIINPQKQKCNCIKIHHTENLNVFPALKTLFEMTDSKNVLFLFGYMLYLHYFLKKVDLLHKFELNINYQKTDFTYIKDLFCLFDKLFSPAEKHKIIYTADNNSSSIYDKIKNNIKNGKSYILIDYHPNKNNFTKDDLDDDIINPLYKKLKKNKTYSNLTTELNRKQPSIIILSKQRLQNENIYNLDITNFNIVNFKDIKNHANNLAEAVRRFSKYMNKQKLIEQEDISFNEILDDIYKNSTILDDTKAFRFANIVLSLKFFFGFLVSRNFITVEEYDILIDMTTGIYTSDLIKNTSSEKKDNTSDFEKEYTSEDSINHLITIVLDFYNNYKEELPNEPNKYKPFSHFNKNTNQNLLCFKNLGDCVDYLLDKMSLPMSSVMNNIKNNTSDIREEMIEKGLVVRSKDRKDYRIKNTAYLAFDITAISKFQNPDCEDVKW